MASRELREQEVSLLPDRAALGSFQLTLAKVRASNSATSLVLCSGGSSSAALAGQTIIVG